MGLALYQQRSSLQETRNDEQVIEFERNRTRVFNERLLTILCQSIFFYLKSKSKSNSRKLFINQNQIKNHILKIDLKSFLK